MGKLRSLQIVRGLAALGVVWEHAVGQHDPHHFTGGAAGVDVFFVLSGYVISHAAANRPETFLRDRLRRIYPTYWLWAAAWLVWAALQGPLDAWRLFTTATLLPAPVGAPLDGYVGVAWTLSFEMLFYVAMWLWLRGERAVFLLLGYTVLLALGLALRAPLLHFFGSPMVIEFLLGVVAYRVGRRAAWAGAFALAAACAWLPLTPLWLGTPYVALTPLPALGRVAMWGVPAALAVWGAAQFDCRWRGWAPLVLLGDASYTLYLSHLLLFMALPALTLWPLVGAGAAVGVAVLAYWVVERPMIGAWRSVQAENGDVAIAKLEHATVNLILSGEGIRPRSQPCQDERTSY